MKEYRNSLICCILFCLISAVLAVYDISSSYSREVRGISTRVVNNSFLIGQWIKGEFNSSDFVLRDIVSHVSTSELLYPHPNLARQKEITDFIKNKLGTLRAKGRLHFVGATLEPLDTGVFPLIMGQRSVSGSPVGSPGNIVKMLNFAAQHNIAPVIEKHSFANINEAIARLRSGEAHFRVVLC